MATNILF